MTTSEIYRLYKRADYDKPKLFKVLADFCGLTVIELNQIIKTEDEKSMIKGTRWTAEQHETYERMTAENAKSSDIASAMGVPVKAVHAKHYKERNQREPAPKKVATINKGFDAESPKPISEPTPLETIDPVETYADTDIDSTSAVGETVQDEPVKVNNIPAVNGKIAKLCELPDPPVKIDYTESLIETLREAIEFREAVYFAEPAIPVKQISIFDRARNAINCLQAMSEHTGINLDRIMADITVWQISISGENDSGDNMTWHKNYQPDAGTSD